MYNFVISIQSATERRQHIENEFGKHSVPFQFFDAVTPATNLDSSIDNFLPNLKMANLTAGEKACFMSHFVLWKKCVDENLPYIAVFEDDVILGKNANDFLNHSEWLYARFAKNLAWIIRLETFLHSVHTQPSRIAPFQYREFEQLNSLHLGTAGYLISQQACQILIEKIQTLPDSELTPLDNLIYEVLLHQIEMTVYQLNPSLCVQEEVLHKENSQLGSGLQPERHLRQLNEQKQTQSNKKNKILHTLLKPKRMYEKYQKNKKLRYFKIIPFQ